jgi:nucleoside-diphosphate-sugar epimerase
VELRHIPVDLLDPAQCRERLTGLQDVTHIFYCALVEAPDLAEENARNTAMTAHFLDAVMPQAKRLEHVHFVEGVKWYGYHLGAYPTPAREDDPPCEPPYFYSAQHALVLQHQQGKDWSWSTTRPGAVCGYASHALINLMTVLAVYATVMKALGEPLYYPGTASAYEALTFASDVGMLNRAMLWASTDPAAANQAFNIGNGDSFRWRWMWPRIARLFGMEAGPVRPVALSEFMADKAPLWDRLIAQHGLVQTDFHKLAPWRYADTVFRRDWDNCISTVKANRHGFTEMMDSEDMMARIFDEFRAARIIPA